MVTLRITLPDDEIQTALVHEKLLCTASPVFKAALQCGFGEATTKAVTIVDVDITTIQDFLYWLYHEKCRSTPDLVRYAKLNKFADMYDIAWLKYDAGLATLASVKTVIQASSGTKFSFPFVRQAYDNSAPGDIIRKVLVAIYVQEVSFSVLQSAESEKCLSSCLEFGSDVAIEMVKVNVSRYDRNPTGVDASKFPKPVNKSETEQDIKPIDATKASPDTPSSASPPKRRPKQH